MTTSDDHADKLYRFSFDGLPMRGQWVRLEASLSEAFSNHVYPAPIADLLATQLAAVAMFADNLKFQGAVALQSRGSGALLRSLAECREQHKLRGIAHLDQTQFEQQPQLSTEEDLRHWLGQGQLALSLIDRASGHIVQQAMIELNAADLARNLENYFVRSEQLPTLIYFGRATTPLTSVTALLLQRLPAPSNATDMALQSHDEAWATATALADTLRGDPQGELAELAPLALLQRIFHEFPCRLHPPRALTYACTCSKRKSDRTLLTLGAEELRSILDELGHVQVDCEFCGRRYQYGAVEIANLKQQGPEDEPAPLH
ncbi:MAG: Hsp33 family molecular chaperone HslO [Pseudomonadales bacterium]